MRKMQMIVAALALLVSGATASADFAGQPILGPLGPNSVVNGDTTGAADDNDGFDSGGHFFDIWNGPDDAWQVNWPGGDLSIDIVYNHTPSSDLDLFLYEPGSYDSTGNYSVLSTGFENVSQLDAPAGIYYVVVDGYDGGFGPYTLSVSPEPTTAALLGLAFAAMVRRSRKSR